MLNRSRFSRLQPFCYSRPRGCRWTCLCQSSIAVVLWQISAAWKRDKDAGSWVYLSGLKKTCFFTTAIGTELIWCSGVLLLLGIFFLETVWKLQGDSAIAWKFLPAYICFWSSKRKTCFCAVMVKLKPGRHKGLVYSFWGGEHIMQCNISGVVFLVFFFIFFTWVKPSLFPFSWDCNSWNQNCIFHKCVILTATSIQDTPGCLFSWVPDIVMQNQCCIILHHEYPKAANKIQDFIFYYSENPRGSCTAAVLQFSALSRLCFPSSAA